MVDRGLTIINNMLFVTNNNYQGIKIDAERIREVLQ
jgi:hypothetical protein